MDDQDTTKANPPSSQILTDPQPSMFSSKMLTDQQTSTSSFGVLSDQQPSTPSSQTVTDLQLSTCSSPVMTKQDNLICSTRVTAKEDILLQASKMLPTSKKNSAAQIGDNVRIQVSGVNRGLTDPRNVLATVIVIEDLDFYKLADKDGTSKQLFTRHQFAICKGAYTRCTCKKMFHG
nr:unnamed protein product [Callosobruchus analis]